MQVKGDACRHSGNDHGTSHRAIIVAQPTMRFSLRLCSGSPFEKLALADEYPVHRSEDGISHHRSRMGNENDAKQDLCRGRDEFAAEMVEMRSRNSFHTARKDALDEPERR